LRDHRLRNFERRGGLRGIGVCRRVDGVRSKRVGVGSYFNVREFAADDFVMKHLGLLRDSRHGPPRNRYGGDDDNDNRGKRRYQPAFKTRAFRIHDLLYVG